MTQSSSSPGNDNKFIKSNTVAIIGAPFSGGQGKGGVDDGPKELMKAGLESNIRNIGWTPEFHGHLEFEEPSSDPDIGRMKRPRFVANSTRKVYEAVKKATTSNQLTLTVGGDHSIAIGTVAGVQAAHPDAVVLWIDAHADLNTPDATESGNLHGCPVSFLLGAAKPKEGEEDVFGWVPKCLDEKRIAYIGLRDVDPFEKQYIREHGITAYSMHDVDKHGIAKVVEMALKEVNPDGSRPIHLSFDVDALDPVFAPATGTPVRGGLTWREACYLCEAVAETNNLVAMDLVEVNPHLGTDDKSISDTVMSGISLVKCALGDTLL
uniref:Arginase n=1 Tax=Blastobotrys adeninivorans TaxID=409370 RepID=A0A060T2B6_BLAAD